MISPAEKIIISLKLGFLLAIPLFITSSLSLMGSSDGIFLGIATILVDFGISFFIFNSLRDNEVSILEGFFTFNDWRKAALSACICVQGGFSILFLIADICKAAHQAEFQLIFSFVGAGGIFAGIGAVPQIINFLLDEKKKSHIFDTEYRDLWNKNQSNQQNKVENNSLEVINTDYEIKRNPVEPVKESPPPIRRRRD